MTVTAAPPFMEVKDGALILRPHFYQQRILDSEARIVLALAGTQSGKTEIGPVWLYREMQRRGPGDYLAVTSTYPLMNNKMRPVLDNYFVKVLNTASWRESRQTFEFRDGARLILGSAANPETLEAATAKGAWLDEAGQNQFDREAWDAVNRRVARWQGRILITTTPYNFGWLKTDVYDRWERGDGDIEVIQFPSVANPAFPLDEWERMKRILPAWKFRMFAEGRFSRPVGLIYDVFDYQRHVITPIELNKAWPRYVGMDFGGRNTAALWYAHDYEKNILYLYREYLAGQMTAGEHVNVLKNLSQGENIARIIGGAPSEDNWRVEFIKAGWVVQRPEVRDVDVGIAKVYGLHKQDRIRVFKNCVRYIDQKMRYAYKLDDGYTPTNKIEDKETYHLLDAERYILSGFDFSRQPAMTLEKKKKGEMPKLMEWK